MLDFLNLTHMNGRVYDQIAGRFLSADPFVPVPEFTQSFNRYSYVFNSPLRYTDPSGFQPDPDDWVDPPGPNCTRTCFDRGYATDVKRRPVPWIGLRDGAKRVPFSGLECDQVCSGAQNLGTVQKIGAFLFPNVAALGERGVPGTATNNIVGGLKAAHNLLQGLAVASNPSLAIQSALGHGPQPLEIADNELGGAALVEGATAVSGVFGVTRSLASRGAFVTVGRWMSQAELNAMRATGRVQESYNTGVTSVTRPPNAGAYRAAPPGDVFVRFDVPQSAIGAADGVWAKIFGPNSIFGRARGVKEMPPATNIVVE